MDNLPRAAGRAQADASAWMAFFARNLARSPTSWDGPRRRIPGRRGPDRRGSERNLWNEQTGFYHDQGGREGTLILTTSYSGLIPLIAGIVPPDREAACWTRWATRRSSSRPTESGPSRRRAFSTSRATRASGVNSNWRGPVWLPINYLLVQALSEAEPQLATTIRQRVVDAVEADWQAPDASTNTSTPTPARASAPTRRPAGPRWSPT